MRAPIHLGKWQRWLATAFVLLLLLTTAAQAADMCCSGADVAGCRTCVTCASMHGTTPAPAVAPQVRLVAVALVAIAHELNTPSYEASLPLFIRPPPSL